jgi:predicted deacylase
LSGWAQGFRIEIPFFVFVGKERQPQGLLIAGVHGDEYESVAALQDLAREIKAEELLGTLLIVPVANPQAFFAGTRRNPVDQGDLNRSFPGNPEGSQSERLAHLLFQEVVLGSDCILSMHCWSKEATVVPYVEYPDEATPVARKSYAAAAALGLDFLHPYNWPDGMLVAAAVRRGIPAIEPEVGGMGTVTRSGQRAYRDIVHHFLKHLNMFPVANSARCSSDPEPKIIHHTDCLANYAGFFRGRVDVGDEVAKGDLIGTVHSLTGETIEQVQAPRDGTIGILRVFCSVQPGDRLAQLFWRIGALPTQARPRLR